MRRYSIDAAELIHLIDVESPATANKLSWLARARKRTDEYKIAGDYGAGSEFWGEIKRVYIKLQNEKCAYCETRLQGARLASKVHEVEHFRPKSSVKAWPPSKVPGHLAGFSAPCALGSDSAKGYYLLAYHPFNYAIGCTRCNSTLKSNFFPVAGKRAPQAEDPSDMDEEESLLIYPISSIDDDPGSLIGFEGVVAIPRAASGFNRHRAQVTIAFFQLNHEDLTLRRAEKIDFVYAKLREKEAATSERRVQIDKDLAILCSEKAEFSGCIRDFCALYQSDLPAAQEFGNLANELQMTLNGGNP